MDQNFIDLHKTEHQTQININITKLIEDINTYLNIYIVPEDYGGRNNFETMMWFSK